MFGHIQANLNDLSEAEQIRYKAAYCGLCRTLGKRHGVLSRLTLTYDLTYMVLLLSSLYEPEEAEVSCRCCVHPCKKQRHMSNACTEYAADMSIVLTYFKCLDDWNDDRNIVKKCFASLLRTHYNEVKDRWPGQCAHIECSLKELSEIERTCSDDPDAGARCFGRLMTELFVFRRDRWEEDLRRLGYGLGQYIYLADAVEDYDDDLKTGNYNPLKALSDTARSDMRPTLSMVLGDASAAFERLPLVRDAHLLRNILYSGIWIRYNRTVEKAEKVRE